VGYLLGAPDLLARLRWAQPLWPVSSLGLAAAVASSAPRALTEAAAAATEIGAHRRYLIDRLASVLGVATVPGARGPFVLARVRRGTRIWAELRRHGIPVRRGDSFPGLGPGWLRIAVRRTEITDHLINVLAEVIADQLTVRGKPIHIGHNEVTRT
jgi:histidinol-phosphate aminotransferase